jgi:hypothetical protein
VKVLSFLIALAFALVLAVPVRAAVVDFHADLNGSQEPTASPATGTADVTLNDVTDMLTVNLTFTGLVGGPATAAHPLPRHAWHQCWGSTSLHWISHSNERDILANLRSCNRTVTLWRRNGGRVHRGPRGGAGICEYPRHPFSRWRDPWPTSPDRRPRTVNMGHDPSRLRWRRLHGISPPRARGTCGVVAMEIIGTCINCWPASASLTVNVLRRGDALFGDLSNRLVV